VRRIGSIFFFPDIIELKFSIVKKVVLRLLKAKNNSKIATKYRVSSPKSWRLTTLKSTDGRKKYYFATRKEAVLSKGYSLFLFLN